MKSPKAQNPIKPEILTSLVAVNWKVPSRPNLCQHWSKTFRSDKAAHSAWTFGLLVSADGFSMTTTIREVASRSEMPSRKAADSTTEIRVSDSTTPKSNSALTCPLIITSASTRADGSIGLRLSTPELKSDEKAAFFDLQGQQLKMLLQPESLEPAELKDVKGEFDCKTPGQRLRGTIFVLWKQRGEPGDYDGFYKRQMEKIIDFVKSKLNPA